MLRRLIIKDYAIIENVDIAFDKGLNILTGETGAGKSIVIGALGLLLGEQASVDFIRKGSKQCTVEGFFPVRLDSPIKTFLEQQDIFVEKEVILRREVHSEGKGRCFIDDSPVPLYIFKQLGNLLVDLHGQHQHQSLLNPECYYYVVDSFGGTLPLAEKTEALYRQLKELDIQKRQLLKKAQLLKEKRELLRFQLNEIYQVDPSPGEDEEIDRELKILENREKIWELSQQSYQVLYNQDGSVTERIQEALKWLREISEFDVNLGAIIQNLEESKEIIQDSASYLLKYSDPDAFNPDRLEELRARMLALLQLKRKYGGNMNAVLKKKDEIESDLSLTDSLDLDIETIEKNRKRVLNEFTGACIELSKKRTDSSQHLGNEIIKALAKLGMKDAIFQAAVVPQESSSGLVQTGGRGYQAGGHGIDRIEFLIATNKGEDLKPLAKIASGGEISRVMLAVKGVLADRDRIPVMVFDEIDTGISGRIATIVAKKLRELACTHQLICITHLPQIAGMGEAHFTAEKISMKNRVKTRIRKLSYDERKVEIAKILGGEEITKANIKNAEELLKAGKHG